jgi:integrase/recombinase XerD
MVAAGHGQAIGWARSTAEGYQRQLRQTAAFCQRRGCGRAADVVPADLDALLGDVRDRGWARSYRVHLAVLLKATFRWLHDQGRIVTDPARSVPIPRDGEAPLPAPPLSEAEVQAIFASLPRASVFDLRNAAALELLYGCGLRVSEVCALDMDDLDLSRQTLRVCKSKWGQDRLLPVMTTAVAAVQDYFALRRTLLKGPDRGILFLNQNGRRLVEGTINVWLNGLNDRRGPEAQRLHPHLFRHSIAVHLLRGGADIRHIQAFLGHADLNTTKVYLRLVPGRLKEDYDRAMPEIAVGMPTAGGR